MRTIGFPKPKKENENRRAITLESISRIVKRENIFIEQGYGEIIGISNEEYSSYGANIVERSKIFSCDVICNPKAGSPDEYDSTFPGQIIFGWIHAVEGEEITKYFINKKLTGYAWEDMYIKGKHIFWRNNYIAGEAALIHALTLWGSHEKGLRVAIIGRGNVSQGAIGVCERFGFNVEVYNRKMEALLREKIHLYDIVINGVLWDVMRKDHLLSREDIKRMKKGSLIVDISCDEGMGIETTRATSFSDPVYWEENVMHYAVDHTPSLFFKVASKEISNEIVPYINQFICGEIDDILNNALNFKNGDVINQTIIKHLNLK